MTGEPVTAETHRRLAVDLYNHVWSLLRKGSRTRAEDDELVHAAHASRYHWGQVGTPANFARGEWQCARVYAVLGLGEASLRHAHRCLELVEGDGEGFEDWDLAAACEAITRAHLTCGDAAAARAAAARAATAAAHIADPEDRALIQSDLADLERQIAGT